MSLEFFSKDVIGSLESIFFLKKKQNKTKQTKQKENRGVTTLIELKYGLAILS